MELHEGNDAGFYSLVRKQRDPANTTTSSLTFNDISLNNDNLIRDAWMDYFQDLASPMDSENFDKEHFSLVENDIKHLTKTFTENKIENISPVTEVEMKNILASMKNNKSADEENIAAEHLKYGGPIMITVMTFFVNAIFKHLHIPTLLKGGIACPVLKNGKPKIDPNSYRKITITSTVGKVVEKAHLSQNKNSVTKNQNKLQKGFTSGEMPIIAALILTELIIQAIKTKSPLYVALMDARKAFDIVWHLGLMREMNKFGLTGGNWLVFKRWYANLKSKIKWKWLLSNSIEEQQDVRQGGIWLPTAYKIFINSLLQTFERNQLGACIRPIYCGIPTVADDVALISTDPYELQTMLNVQADHANKLRYLLSEQKSTILVYNDKLPKSWTLNGKSVTLSESAVHLGIDRNITKNAGVKEVVSKRITTARKTVYSLMGAGLHGLNGVNPKVSVHLIQIYVIPRLLYGLDVISLSNTDIQKMELFFRQLLKQIQHLPKRTSIAATLLLLGRIPIEGEIHKKILKTFGNIIRNDKSVEREIAFRQLAMKDEKSGNDLLESTQYRAFWISWRDGIIEVGRGLSVRNTSSRLLIWSDPEPLAIAGIFLSSEKEGSFIVHYPTGNTAEYTKTSGKQGGPVLLSYIVGHHVVECAARCHQDSKCINFNFKESSKMCELLQARPSEATNDSLYNFYSQC
ncbi:Hypothetical predicted protein [Mytilus galloprovincialis]|uniref:Reverse transcriptase domain-containing protein n=1 Tax=Mytilus galloprovincialis TaxID=29158 RepID=A0A8B6HDM3_MYTGA|nr:Hypothetical predicted protein [Mytilus galloprovincialis]